MRGVKGPAAWLKSVGWRLSAFMTAALMSAFMSHAAAAGPSFDCTKARSNVEYLICGDEDLAELDGWLATVLRTRPIYDALAGVDSAEVLLRGQREWLRERNARCGPGEADVPDARRQRAGECLREMYTRRIQALQADMHPAVRRLLDLEPSPVSVHTLACLGRCRDETGRNLLCDDRFCYSRSIYGGLGLLPKRGYVVEYAAEERVCRSIADALNWPFSQSPEILAATWESLAPEGWATTNLLFSHSTFVRWHRVAGSPVDPGAMPTQIERWVVAPLFNDGIPRLVTRTRGTPDLWDYSVAELGTADWSLPASYHPARRVRPESNPIKANADFRSLIGDEVVGFPKLAPDRRKQEIWRQTDRHDVGEFEIAVVEGKYYSVFLSADIDTVLVTDLSRPPGEDACYLHSSFSQWAVNFNRRR
jgi:uncharacterized protein YecT (DUF1311 family)